MKIAKRIIENNFFRGVAFADYPHQPVRPALSPTGRLGVQGETTDVTVPVILHECGGEVRKNAFGGYECDCRRFDEAETKALVELIKAQKGDQALFEALKQRY
jgi:hypothetical protein